MPNSIVKSFAEKSNKSVEEVEELWNKAKEITDKMEHIEKESDQYYAYITGTVKNMLGLE